MPLQGRINPSLTAWVGRCLNSLCLPGAKGAALFASLVVSFSPGNASAGTCFSPPAGLVGWWAGEGDATDLAGTNNGNLLGGATATNAGLVGTAFAFDGTNAFVQIPDAPELRPANLTVETWVRFSSLDSSGNAPAGLQYLVFKQNSRASNFEGFSLGKGRVGGFDYFAFTITSASAQQVFLQSVTTISTGVWYHVAATRSANLVQLFVNGQLENQAAVGFPQDYGNYPLLFGSSGEPSFDRKLSGALDEVSLYNRALTSNEIAAVYAAGSAGKCRPPRIVTPPQSQSVVVGHPVSFTVGATGEPPLAYQWTFNNSNLPGARGSVLALNAAQLSNSGNYSVVVSNSIGSATSAVAVLTVLLPPVITSQPQSRTNLAGTTATFSLAVTGSVPVVCFWRFNGSNLVDNPHVSGSGSSSLSISGVEPADAGFYSAIASNAAGIAPTALASLMVFAPPSILSGPSGIGVLVGSNVTLQTTAAGSAPLYFQWLRNGTALSDGGRITGSSSSSLTILSAQTNDSGSYQLLVTNNFGSVTSGLASLSVTITPVAPGIVVQPAPTAADPGASSSFTVTANGTIPLLYRWQKNGTPLNDGSNLYGTASPTLTLSNLAPSDAAGYRVVITNVAGAVTSAVANLTLNPQIQLGADAAVLVNSASAFYTDFTHFVQPYLDNFGVPYAVIDVATNGAGTNLNRFALMIIGHRQLDTNQIFLSATVQSLISAAVFNGSGLVSFDDDLSVGTTPRYQFVQDVFGYGYADASAGNSVSFPSSAPSGGMHYISALHPTNESMLLSNSLSVANLVLSSNATPIVFCGAVPLVSTVRYGQGRAVQWSSYAWMSTSVQGPLNGLDDLVWRGLVWAARKPFVMRGLPNFLAMRIDDCAGPFDWVHAANLVGFKPFLALFISDIAPAYMPDLRNLITNGNATASIHAFTASTLFYFDHTHETSYSDSVISNNFYIGTQWHLTNGIPFPKNVIAHYSEMGPNSFPGLKSWGVEYVPIEVAPGSVEYGTPPAPWLVAGPYRRFETPQPGESNLPLFYADFLSIPGHPELDGQFFDRYTEIRDTVAPGANDCGEWCPSNDVQGSIDRGTRQIKRAFDSLILASVFSHEWYIQNTPSVINNNPITPANWLAILQGITNNLAAYKPIFVTTEYGDQYIRATRTSRLLSASVDLGSGRVNATLSGHTDLPTSVTVFYGADNTISNLVGTVPVFTNVGTFSLDVVTQALPPLIFDELQAVASPAGGSASLALGVGGLGPINYRWFKSPGTPLFDGGNAAGTATATLSLSNLSGYDAGSYFLVASNSFGSVTSAPVVVLVSDPMISAEPQSRTNHAGTAASFNLVASASPPVAYRWYKAGAPLPTATGATLTLPSVGVTDAGIYTATVSNRFGTATSLPVSLAVVGPLRISSFSMSQGVALVSWEAIPGRDYILQRQSRLGTTNWNSQPSVHATNSLATASDLGGQPSGHFYRVQLVP